MPFNYYGQVYPISTPSGTDYLYQRPSDWLALPSLAPGDERMVGLFSVFDDDSNFLAVYFEGDYIVDWGDGNVENFASGATAEHTYDYATISNSTLTGKGYKQVIVSVTPQTTGLFSSLNLNVRHSKITGSDSSCPWLDISVSMPNAAAGRSLTFTDNNANYNYLGSLESVSLYDTGGCEDLSYCFSYSSSLRQVVVKEMPQVTDIDYMFNYCGALTVVILPDLPAESFDMFYGCGFISYVSVGDISNVSDINDLFYGPYGIKEIYIKKVGADLTELCYDDWSYTLEKITIGDASSLEYADYAFYDSPNLRIVNLPATPNLISSYFLFGYCYSLESIQFSDLSGLVDASYMFYGCSSIRSATMPPTPLLASIPGMFEDCIALESVDFQSLPSLTNATEAFYGCDSLMGVELNSVPSGLNTAYTFYSCYSLATLQLNFAPGNIMQALSYCTNLVSLEVSDASQLSNIYYGGASAFAQPLLAHLRVPGIDTSFSVGDCSLSKGAIVQIFQDLAVVSLGSQTLDVGGNWGAPSLSPVDIQIATDKGWIVTT